MKVLEILNAFPGETFLREHAKALIQHASEIDLIWAFTQTNKVGPLPTAFEEGPNCFAIPNFNRLSKIAKAKFALKNIISDRQKLQSIEALQLIRQIAPDIIHFQFATTALQWSWLAEKAKVPYTFSLRGSDVHVRPIIDNEYVEKIKKVSQKAVSIHSVCNAIKEQFCELVKIPDEKIVTVRTTVENTWQDVNRIPVDGLILSVGRLHWIKGFADLLLAVRTLKNKGLRFELKIIGDGAERQRLEYMIRDLEISEVVKLEGRKSHQEIRTYFAQTDVMVQASLQEGFPNSLAEAMTAGIPIVTTDCNGVTEILKNELNAWVASTGDHKDLAQCIESALSLKSKKEEFAQEAKRTAIATFSYSAHADKFQKFWAPHYQK